MPLRDHFRPPVSRRASWEGFHGMWPAVMVQHLVPRLPEDYSAEPRTHLGSYFEIDVCTFEDEGPEHAGLTSRSNGAGTATASWASPEPTLSTDIELTDEYEYEVLIYDQSRGRMQVAAVEMVSPANKDCAENRRAFVTKCAALLQKGVSVSIVDLVTARSFNLYTELLALLDRNDPAFAPEPPATYAVTCRCRRFGETAKLGTWAHRLDVGQPLPSLPIWLNDELNVPLELESSYEETCRVLRIA
ncbi:MAG: DUF4058 family protein [Gemmataceae bacterium]